MDIVNIITDFIVSAVMLPMVIVFAPIDALLQFIPGISELPQYIFSVINFVGTVPDTLVTISGLSPILWNLSFNLFLLYIVIAPSLNLIKIVLEWIRS